MLITLATFIQTPYKNVSHIQYIIPDIRSARCEQSNISSYIIISVVISDTVLESTLPVNRITFIKHPREQTPEARPYPSRRSGRLNPNRWSSSPVEPESSGTTEGTTHPYRAEASAKLNHTNPLLPIDYFIFWRKTHRVHLLMLENRLPGERQHQPLQTTRSSVCFDLRLRGCALANGIARCFPPE